MEIERLMQACGWQASSLDYVAAGIGPGSYTGLRVGVTCAKTICYITGAALVGVVSLDVLAANAADADATVCPVLDAKRGQVYAAWYRVEEGETTRLREPAVMAPADLIAEVPKPVVLLGDGIDAYCDLLQHPEAMLADQALWRARAEIVGVANAEGER